MKETKIVGINDVNNVLTEYITICEDGGEWHPCYHGRDDVEEIMKGNFGAIEGVLNYNLNMQINKKERAEFFLLFARLIIAEIVEQELIYGYTDIPADEVNIASDIEKWQWLETNTFYINLIDLVSSYMKKYLNRSFTQEDNSYLWELIEEIKEYEEKSLWLKNSHIFVHDRTIYDVEGW